MSNEAELPPIPDDIAKIVQESEVLRNNISVKAHSKIELTAEEMKAAFALPSKSIGLDGKTRYRCGTLTYTKTALFFLLFWLLFGDFVYTFSFYVFPNTLPYLLSDLGASDVTIMLLNKSIVYASAFLLSPAISYRSDRHRGRRGRRMPFLLYSTPVVAFFLVAMGFYREIAEWLCGDSGAFMGIELATLYVGVIGTVLILFELSNEFVKNLYYYLFNDVVPEHLLGRTMALFRIVGLLGSACFLRGVLPWILNDESIIPDVAPDSWWLVGGMTMPSWLAGINNFKLVMIVAGTLFGIGYSIMCIKVKEGKYTPPPETVDKRTGVFSSIKTYAKECFTHKFYWCFFLSNAFWYIAGTAYVAMMLRNRETLGLSMGQIANIGFYSMIIGALLTYPAGWLGDRLHPVRVYFLFLTLAVLTPILHGVWMFYDFLPQWNYYLQFSLFMFLLPMNTLRDAAEIPMYMRLLPKERFGQFCSANEMIRSFCMIFFPVIFGICLVLMKDGKLGWEPMGSWRYRIFPIWVLFWQIPGIFCFAYVYREWKRRGGKKGYTPPEAGYTASDETAESSEKAE